MGRQFNLALVAGLALPAAMALNGAPNTSGEQALSVATAAALRDTTDSLYDTTAKGLPSKIGRDTLERVKDSLQRRMEDTVVPKRDTMLRDTTLMPRDTTLMPRRDTIPPQEPTAMGKDTTMREKPMRRTTARTRSIPQASSRVHVMALQQELRDEGCGPAHATGRVDSATRRAIQCAHDRGLAKGNTVDELLASMDIAFSETQ